MTMVKPSFVVIYETKEGIKQNLRVLGSKKRPRHIMEGTLVMAGPLPSHKPHEVLADYVAHAEGYAEGQEFEFRLHSKGEIAEGVKMTPKEKR